MRSRSDGYAALSRLTNLVEVYERLTVGRQWNIGRNSSLGAVRRLVGRTGTLRMDHCHALKTAGRVQTLLAYFVSAHVAWLLEESSAAMSTIDATLTSSLNHASCAHILRRLLNVHRLLGCRGVVLEDHLARVWSARHTGVVAGERSSRSRFTLRALLIR